MPLSVVLCLVMLGVADLSAQDRRITVRVEDPSGATIPNASIIVLAGSDLITEQNADPKGLATIAVGAAQRLKLVVTAEGFSTTEVDVVIPSKAMTHPVTVAMRLANIETDVTVSAAEDVAAGGLTETLSQAQIDQLPDDPDELQRMLLLPRHALHAARLEVPLVGKWESPLPRDLSEFLP